MADLKYVVDIVEVNDPANGVKGYRRRFTFATEDDALIAFAKATAHGLDATLPVRVRSLRG